VSRRQISRLSRSRQATQTASAAVLSVERLRISAVGGRDPKVGSEPANENAGRGQAVIACWVIYLVILADRPRTRSMGNGANSWAPNPLPAGANHRHWWKLKTHFITRLILRAVPRPPSPQPTLRPFCTSFSSPSPHPSSPLLTSSSSFVIVPPHASSFLFPLSLSSPSLSALHSSYSAALAAPRRSRGPT